MRPRPSPLSPAVVALSALALAAVSLPACSASPPPPPATAATLIEWALGPEHLDGLPHAGENYVAELDADPSKTPPQPAQRTCSQVTSILPAPAPDTQLYALIGGKLHTLATRNAQPVPLTGGNPAVSFTRLLAFSRAPAPTTLLVAARPPGATNEQIWALTLENGAIKAAGELADKRAYASQDAFFGAFNAPRCKPGGKQCLALSSNGKDTFLDIEQNRGDRPTTLRPLPTVAIDASWASSDGRRIVVVMPCAP